MAAAGLSGCASMQPGLGFDDVGRSVSERTGQRVHWDNGSAEDGQARAAVRALLADELTADGAVQIALLNNRALQAVYEDLNLAQADLVQAGLLRNPVFGGEVRWATSGGGVGVVLDLSQDFLSLLTMGLRQGRAGAAFELAKARVAGAVLDLAGETRGAYYELVAAEQMRELRGTILESMSASAELAERLRAAGNFRELDVVSERAAAEEARLELAAAEAEIVQRREVLNEHMGLWGAATGWRAPGRLLPVPTEEISGAGLESRAVSRSLALEADRREIEVAGRALGLAQPLALLGELDVGVAAEREIDGQWSVGPSLSLPIPLFDQGQGAIGKARAELRGATQRYYANAVSLRARVRAAHAALLSARARTTYIEQVVLPLRAKIVSESQLQYNAMQIGAFQLLQARRDQAEGGVRYVESLRGYWLARARLEQLLGGPPSRERWSNNFDANPRSSSTDSREGGH
ncbi:TolC family protein [soil metagenome]